MVGRRHLKLLLAAIVDGVIDPKELDPFNTRTYIRAGIILNAYRQKKELEWLRFKYEEIDKTLRSGGLTERPLIEQFFDMHRKIRQRLEAGALHTEIISEQEVVKTYKDMWQYAYGDMSDEQVTRSIDLVVAALQASDKSPKIL